MIASDRLAETSVQLQLLRLLKLQLEVLLIWILVQLQDFIVDEQLLSLRHQQVRTQTTCRSPLQCFQPDVIDPAACRVIGDGLPRVASFVRWVSIPA